VRRVGRGAAVFLNGALAEITARGDVGLAAAKNLMAALLDAAQVRPLFEVEPLGSARVVSHALGKVTLLSVVRQSEATTPTIVLTEKAWVYDCLRQKALGKTDKITPPADSKGFDLYAAARAELKSPRLTVPASAPLGRVLQVGLRLPDGEGRLVRLDVYRPDGTWVRPYRRFVPLKDTRATVPVPLAFNDSSGPWTLRATDLASGLKDEATLLALRLKR
jgi:hypothetical protein